MGTKIRIQPGYNFIMPCVLSFTLFILTFIPYFLFGFNQEQVFYQAIWFTMMPLFAITALYIAGRYYQTATFETNRVVVKNCFYIIKSFEYTDVLDAECRLLPSGSQLGKPIFAEWIVLYLTTDSHVTYGGENGRKSNVIYITRTRENCNAVAYYLNKHEIRHHLHDCCR